MWNDDYHPICKYRVTGDRRG
jgi:hypothetical protein